MAVTEYCSRCGQYHVQTSAGCPNYSDGIVGKIEFGPPTFYPKLLNIPFKCPVCEGSGLVSSPPNVAVDQETWTSDSTGPFECKACKGSGIVWSNNDYF